MEIVPFFLIAENKKEQITQKGIGREGGGGGDKLKSFQSSKTMVSTYNESQNRKSSVLTFCLKYL